jgi:hypothetical protein
MRMMHQLLLAAAALVVACGPAAAVEVNKKIAVPGDMDVIWTKISEFCSIKDWHPALSNCTESKEGGDTIRVLTLKDGGTIKEKLDESDDTSYSYEILESPLPVKDYHAKLWIEPDPREQDRAVVHWDATFEANGASDEDAAKTVGDIFLAGLKSIKHQMLPPEGDSSGQE